MVRVLRKISNQFFIKRMKRIHAFTVAGADIQTSTLMSFVKESQDTEYGQLHRFSLIENREDFQKLVPLVSYEDLEPYIMRMKQGQENILWPTTIDFFSKSSGTTGSVSKFIPVSYEFLQDCHYRGGKDMIALYTNQFPESGLLFGKTFALSGSLSEEESNKVLSGDVSAVVLQNLPLWARAFRTPPQEVALLSNWEEKSKKIIDVISREDIRAFAGAPAWILAIIKGVSLACGGKKLKEIWPHLEVFFYGGTSIKPFEQELNDLIGEPIRYMSIYNASEGFFGLQDDLTTDGEMLLMLDYDIVYEFLPFPAKPEDAPVFVDGVEVGKKYELIITTSSGLWRYRIGDVVEIVSNNPLKIKIAGRTKQCINIFGEELMVHNAEDALREVCEKYSARVAEFTVAPIFQTKENQGGHQWLVEFEMPPSDVELFAHDLDKVLRTKNSDYDAKRNEAMGVLAPLVLSTVPRGTFVSWLSSKNKLGGQHKVPRLSSERIFLEEIFSFAK